MDLFNGESIYIYIFKITSNLYLIYKKKFERKRNHYS